MPTTPPSLRDAARFRSVRKTTEKLCTPLTVEDHGLQSMPDASPPKWHLAHTTWFFERFVLREHMAGYTPFDERFDVLFNSYYQSVGPMHRRAGRGILSRPSLQEIMAWRSQVDAAVEELQLSCEEGGEIHRLLELGMNHEQQHQELLLTDVLHAFSQNPMEPAYGKSPLDLPPSQVAPLEYVIHDGGLEEIGAGPETFSFDNEGPRHKVFVAPFALARRLVTQGEYLEFLRADGYRRPEFWMSDGFDWVQANGIVRPLYWSSDLATVFTLAGRRPLDPSAPVCHLSAYEADAYARFAGARLPTEAEWESAVAPLAVAGNLLDTDLLDNSAGHAPAPRPAPAGNGLVQCFGDVWEWTSSAYSAYPGYHPPAGPVGEYNGKFMINQLVLRGGSCATPAAHIRATYRNFFPAATRWQFAGLRLAKDVR